MLTNKKNTQNCNEATEGIKQFLPVTDRFAFGRQERKPVFHRKAKRLKIVHTPFACTPLRIIAAHSFFEQGTVSNLDLGGKLQPKCPKKPFSSIENDGVDCLQSAPSKSASCQRLIHA